MGRDANTIVLVGKGHYDEGEADAAILPGIAVALAGDGNWDPTTATEGLSLALESALNGKTIDDAYADGDRLFIYHPIPGDVVNVLVVSGEDIAVGDRLAVSTGGKFAETAAGNLVALESSGGALAADGFIRARVLSTILNTTA